MTIKFAKDGRSFAEPFKPQHLRTRAGGTVLEVTGCDHIIGKPANGFSTDDWWFNCKVTFDDSNEVEERGYHPSQIIYEGEFEGQGHKEVCTLSDAMMDYLRRHGEWSEGKVRGWVAHREVERSAK